MITPLFARLFTAFRRHQGTALPNVTFTAVGNIPLTIDRQNLKKSNFVSFKTDIFLDKTLNEKYYTVDLGLLNCVKTSGELEHSMQCEHRI